MAFDVPAIAVAAQGCELVVGLHAGPFDTISSTVGRSRVIGVRIDGDTVVIGVISAPGVNSVRVADEVRAAVRIIEPEATVGIRIERDDPAIHARHRRSRGGSERPPPH